MEKMILIDNVMAPKVALNAATACLLVAESGLVPRLLLARISLHNRCAF